MPKIGPIIIDPIENETPHRKRWGVSFSSEPLDYTHTFPFAPEKTKIKNEAQDDYIG